MIQIYGTDWCTFCKKAQELCIEQSLDFEYIDIDDTANLRALESRMGEKVKHVPQIFIDDRFIEGGYSGLQDELVKI